MAGSLSMGSGVQDSDDPSTVTANAPMSTEHLDVALLKELWQSYGEDTNKSRKGFERMFLILQDRKIISSANIKVLEQFRDSVLWATVEPSSDSSSSDDPADGSTVSPSGFELQQLYFDPLSYCQERYKKFFIQKEPLGKGSFGTVYKVQKELETKHYAVKKIKVAKSELYFYESMYREIKILARLDHPNVVRYHQSWFEDEMQVLSTKIVRVGHGPAHQRPVFTSCLYLYIQMELCSSTLEKWLEKRNRKISKTESQFDVVNEKENQNIYKQILEGMNYIHGKYILHRDVAPKNIFLSDQDDGQLLVKIGDFGVAREHVLSKTKTSMRQLDQALEGLRVSKSLTSGIGTLDYAAPEQYTESTYDNKCDMYGMGLILFELYHPFRTIKERNECFDKVYEGNIPEELKTWPTQYSAIQSLTSRDSAERPSASDLLSGGMFPPKDKIVIKSQADEIQRLKKLLAEKDAEISQLKETEIPQT